MKKTAFLVLSILYFNIIYTQAQVYDVCVYGGTSAGVIAAYTAKMAGKTVILIEPSRHLGGLSSGGLGQTDIGNKYAITGIARRFYRDIGKHYGKFEQWTFEPHVAENLFNQYVKRAKVPVLYEYRLVSVQKNKRSISGIKLEKNFEKTKFKNPISNFNGEISAKMFIDCTYEGDLMALSGVSYTVGREANSQYNETFNGVQMLNKHQFPDYIDPYKIEGDASSGLLWGINTNALAAQGTGDKLVQTYNFRLCLTKDRANQIPISRPKNYDSTIYELLLRQIAVEKPGNINWGVMHIADMPNNKTDINNKGGFSTDMIGMNHNYPESDYETRKQIINTHADYTKGFLYFVGHDPRMPIHLRNQMLQWGYPKDEYLDNDHFSPQLYIREARRMVGNYVMTQAHCEGQIIAPDAIGLAAYTMDSHNCQRILVQDPKTGRMMVKNEGDVQVGGFPPFPISYGSIVPKQIECENLFVPVCLSATHIAYGSIRMEPVFMALSQTAALGAVMAINSKKAVQNINIQKLQNTLKTNPLMDGSTAEILLDNDVTPSQVEIIGNWKSSKQGGKYAASLLLDDSNGLENKMVRYRPSITKSGKYEVYIFNSNPSGGGGNPGVSSDKTKSSRTTITMVADSSSTSTVLQTQNQINDWIKVGDFNLKKGGSNYLEISNRNADGIVVADAILFVKK